MARVVRPGGDRAGGELPGLPGRIRRRTGTRHRHRPPGDTSQPAGRQISYSHHYWITGGQVETFSAPFRYVWLSELDLMARLAGMTLRERGSNWQRAPFTSDSRSHISVWQRAT